VYIDCLSHPWIVSKRLKIRPYLLCNANGRPYHIAFEWYRFHLLTSNPYFKVTSIFDAEYVSNDIRYSYLSSQWITSKTSHTPTHWCNIEWPLTTLSDFAKLLKTPSVAVARPLFDSWASCYNKQTWRYSWDQKTPQARFKRIGTLSGFESRMQLVWSVCRSGQFPCRPALPGHCVTTGNKIYFSISWRRVTVSIIWLIHSGWMADLLCGPSIPRCITHCTQSVRLSVRPYRTSM